MGASALFARAAAAHLDKQKAAPAPAPVAAGVELTTCARCGAPRQREVLVCRFCGGKL